VVWRVRTEGVVLRSAKVAEVLVGKFFARFTRVHEPRTGGV
jgi:hypothetical protein